MAKRLPMLDWQVIVIAFTQKLFGNAPAVHDDMHTYRGGALHFLKLLITNGIGPLVSMRCSMKNPFIQINNGNIGRGDGTIQ